MSRDWSPILSLEPSDWLKAFAIQMLDHGACHGVRPAQILQAAEDAGIANRPPRFLDVTD